MKKMMELLLIMVVVAGLAACNGEDNSNVDKAKDDEQEQSDVNATDESSVESGGDADAETSNSDNENFDQVFEILESNGLEISDKQAGHDDLSGSIQSMIASINGEEILTFEVYEMEPDHENLIQAKETGQATMVFEGQEGEINVLTVIDNYVFLLPEGHPDCEKVKTLLEENFSAK